MPRPITPEDWSAARAAFIESQGHRVLRTAFCRRTWRGAVLAEVAYGHKTAFFFHRGAHDRFFASRPANSAHDAMNLLGTMQDILDLQKAPMTSPPVRLSSSVPGRMSFPRFPFTR